jgi:hypothetical protein
MTMQKDKGKKFESKIADYIHSKLYEYVDEYHQLYDSLGNVNLKPRREKSSGTTKDCDNDIDMGLALKFFPFSVECKHHASVNNVTINALLSGDVAWFEKTYKQAKTHATAKKLFPLIVFRGNRTCDMVAYKVSDDLPIIKSEANRVLVNGFVIMTLNDFMCSFLNYGLKTTSM